MRCSCFSQEEDINGFDSYADHAKKCYNVEKMEDPSENVLQLLNKLVVEDVGPKQTPDLESSTNQAEEFFNVLDMRKSKQKLLDLDLSLDSDKYSDESLANDVKAYESMLTSVKNTSTNLDLSKNNCVTMNKIPIKNDNHCLNDNSDELKKSVKEVYEESPTITNTAAAKSHFETVGSENISSDKNVCSTKNGMAEKETSPFESVVRPTQKKTNTERRAIDTNEASDKIFQTVKTISPAKEIKTKINLDESKPISLEDDDDDLDFLLALKTPVSPQKVKENNPSAAVVKGKRYFVIN